MCANRIAQPHAQRHRGWVWKRTQELTMRISIQRVCCVYRNFSFLRAIDTLQYHLFVNKDCGTREWNNVDDLNIRPNIWHKVSMLILYWQCLKSGNVDDVGGADAIATAWCWKWVHHLLRNICIHEKLTTTISVIMSTKMCSNYSFLLAFYSAYLSLKQTSTLFVRGRSPIS